MLFETMGNKQSPAVLFFHAMGVTGESGEPVAEHLKEKYFCVLPTSTVYCAGQRYLYTGMRMGEAIPLRWTDIDLENHTLRVEKKVVGYYDRSSRKGQVEVQDYCKTKSSTRTILLTAGLVSILTEYKTAMQQKATDEGLPWSEYDLVFRNAHGNMVTACNLGKWVDKVYRRAGIENATLHTLRHTYATRCFEAGVDVKAISEQLGHANTKTTYDTYIHFMNNTKRREIDKLAGIDRFIA